MAGCAAHTICNPAIARSAEDEVASTVDEVWEMIGPFVTTMGFSGLIGMACAGALKVLHSAAINFPTSNFLQVICGVIFMI